MLGFSAPHIKLWGLILFFNRHAIDYRALTDDWKFLLGCWALSASLRQLQVLVIRNVLFALEKELRIRTASPSSPSSLLSVNAPLLYSLSLSTLYLTVEVRAKTLSVECFQFSLVTERGKSSLPQSSSKFPSSPSATSSTLYDEPDLDQLSFSLTPPHSLFCALLLGRRNK